MDTQLQRRAHEVLEEALERVGEERSSFLSEACAGAPEVRREVDSLLAVDSRLAARLDGRALEEEAQAPNLEPGERIGPYQIVEKIGGGGMGEVYRARRADQEYQREAAIKIIKPGLETAPLLERFRSERQILASLEHPNIARLHEGGTTEAGRPYFVMEFVDGAPIDSFCDRHHLSVRKRLRLFLKVGAAVHFAHQKLVVHRDLKPSNILVSPDGEPKLLDFGISKVLNPSSRLAQTVTALENRALTPEYASPEQILGDPVTTASDVYSLGVLLYELLIGKRPSRWDDERRSSLEIQRAIYTLAPPRPSGAVLGGAEGERISQKRKTTPNRLRRQLRGDLDTIVLKALCKEPEQRYASIQELLEDLRRYLDGLPIRARRGTLRYRLGILLKRHWRGITFLTFLICGLTWVAIDRSILQRETLRERDRAQRVSDFLVEIFSVSSPNESQGNAISAREVLDRGALRIRTELDDAPLVRATLMETMQQVYRNLGLLEDAAEFAEEALALRREELGAGHLDVATSLGSVASLLIVLDRDLDRAWELETEALRIRRLHLKPDSPLIAQALNDLGLIARQRGDLEKGEQLLKEALALDPAKHGQEIEKLATINNLASLLQDQGRYQEAESYFRQALEAKRRLLGPNHPSLGRAANNLALLLMEQQQYDEAEPLLEEALAVSRKCFGEEHLFVAFTLANVGRLHLGRLELDRAEEAYRESVSIRRKVVESSSPHVARGLKHLAEVQLLRGDPMGAEASIRETLEILRQNFSEEHWRIIDAEGVHGAILAARLRFEEAEPLLLHSYEMVLDLRGENAVETHKARRRLRDLYLQQGKDEKADLYQDS